MTPPLTITIPARGYTAAEKARIREGMQCPACFGPWVEAQHRNPFDPHRYLCTECGEQWRADAPQFQSSEAVR